jgi:hypothetical protein
MNWIDKAGWRKEIGDKLLNGEDPLAKERKAFWERIGIMPTAHDHRARSAARLADHRRQRNGASRPSCMGSVKGRPQIVPALVLSGRG